jgi:hypothetical protein
LEILLEEGMEIVVLTASAGAEMIFFIYQR